jgi:DNA-binding transcriptional LysR family regulator
MAKSPSLLDLLAMLPAGDISRTARSLGLSPELLRKRLGAIESTLGVDLLGSATRALLPAETGRLFLEHAGRILSQARDLTRDLEELAGLQAPVINLGTDSHVARMSLGVALGRMITANPRLRAKVTIADFEELAHAVIAGELEFGVADTGGAARHPSRLLIEPVAEYPLRFFVRAGHPLVSASPPTLAAILAFPFATSRIPQRIAVHLAGAQPQLRTDRATGDLLPALRIEDFAAAKLAVAAGDAVGLAPAPAIEADLRGRKLAAVAFEAPWLCASYGVFRARKRTLSRAAQLCIAQLRQVDAAIQARAARTARHAARRKPASSPRPRRRRAA